MEGNKPEIRSGVGTEERWPYRAQQGFGHRLPVPACYLVSPIKVKVENGEPICCRSDTASSSRPPIANLSTAEARSLSGIASEASAMMTFESRSAFPRN